MRLEKFVQNVRTQCKRKGISPTVACEESGAGRNFLQHLKNGSAPSVEKVWQLAQYLGVTVSELLGEIEGFDVPDDQAEQIVTLHDSVPRGRASDVERLSMDEVELVHAYRRATPKERALIDTMLAEYKRGAASAV